MEFFYASGLGNYAAVANNPDCVKKSHIELPMEFHKYFKTDEKPNDDDSSAIHQFSIGIATLAATILLFLY
jgi:hypothetical protein